MTWTSAPATLDRPPEPSMTSAPEPARIRHSLQRRQRRWKSPRGSSLLRRRLSLVWMVDLGNRNVNMVSRRELGDELREAVIGHLLPEDDFEENADEDSAEAENA